MKIILAKDTDKEFELELPFNSKRQLAKERSKFKKEILKKTGNGPCWEFYLQYLDSSYTVDDIKPNKDRGLNFLIRKYGEIEGKKRYEQRLMKDKVKNTLSGFIERYGETDGVIKYYEKNKKLSVSVDSLRKNGHSEEEIIAIKKAHADKSARTLKNYIIEHGEVDGLKKYEEMKSNRSSIWSKDYWIKQGFSEDESKKIVSKFQTRDLNYFLKKYGNDIGTEKYHSFNKKRIASTRTGSRVSKLEQMMFFEISKICTDAESNHTLGRYNVDIFIPSKKLVIEIFGDYWHCNPCMWSEDEYNKTLHITAKEKWVKDKNRIKNIENQGYKVIVLWESEIQKQGFNIEEVLNESIK